MQESRDRGTRVAAGEAGVPTLPLLLNVLWRRRWLIVGVTVLGLIAGVLYGVVTAPLYRATTSVRPGIVSYADTGAPVREWRHKDIVNWFQKQLYWGDLRQAPELEDLAGPPRILVEHLPAGGLYQEGGDVILLQYLATDPDRAALVLDLAIRSFNRQAGADSASSTLNLTRIGLDRTIAELEVDRSLLEVEQQKLDGQIAKKERQVQRLAGQQAQATLDAAIARGRQAYGAGAAATADSALGVERAQLAAMRGSLDDLLRRGDAAAVGEFARALAELDIHVFGVQAYADSLAALAIRSNHLAARHEVQRDEVLAADRGAAADDVRLLQIEREAEVPLKVAKIESQIRSERMRRALLVPLERIGDIQATERPVRPRRLRAIVILTGLAFGAALFLALAVEYISRHREVVFARSEP